MRGKTIVLPATYDAVIYCGLLRENLQTWDHESVTKCKNPNTKKLRNKELEHKYQEYAKKYKEFPVENKCELFDFSFHLVKNGEILFLK